MAKRIRLTEMEAYNVKDYHSDLIQRPATLIKPEDIQLILSGVQGRKTKGRGGSVTMLLAAHQTICARSATTSVFHCKRHSATQSKRTFPRNEWRAAVKCLP